MIRFLWKDNFLGQSQFSKLLAYLLYGTHNSNDDVSGRLFDYCTSREFLRHPHQIWHVWYHFNSDKWFKSHVARNQLQTLWRYCDWKINDHGIQFAHFDNELLVNVFTMGNTCWTSHGLSNSLLSSNEESNCTTVCFKLWN